MDLHTKIIDIFKTAKEQKWPFPKTFDILKEIGVLTYEVSWKNGYYSQVNFLQSSVVEENIEGFKQQNIINTFTPDKAKQALLDHQHGKTNYIEWMHEMACAGVSSYIVDMATRTVIYYNLDKTESITELVP